MVVLIVIVVMLVVIRARWEGKAHWGQRSSADNEYIVKVMLRRKREKTRMRRPPDAHKHTSAAA